MTGPRQFDGMHSVDEIWQRIQDAGNHRITITATTSRGRRRNLATLVGGPGLWYPTTDYLLPTAFDMATLEVALNRFVEGLADALVGFVADEPLRRQIPWAALTLVCDVVHAAGRRSVDIDILKRVVEQYGSRISALESIPLPQRDDAAGVLREAIRSAVVLPSQQR